MVGRGRCRAVCVCGGGGADTRALVDGAWQASWPPHLEMASSPFASASSTIGVSRPPGAAVDTQMST